MVKVCHPDLIQQAQQMLQTKSDMHLAQQGHGYPPYLDLDVPMAQ